MVATIFDVAGVKVTQQALSRAAHRCKDAFKDDPETDTIVAALFCAWTIENTQASQVLLAACAAGVRVCVAYGPVSVELKAPTPAQAALGDAMLELARALANADMIALEEEAPQIPKGMIN